MRIWTPGQNWKTVIPEFKSLHPKIRKESKECQSRSRNNQSSNHQDTISAKKRKPRIFPFAGGDGGPQDHETKDHLAPAAAREVSPLGGVTTTRSFELPGTWYSVNDWFCGMVGWIDAPFVSVCTETRCKNSIEPLGKTRTLQESSDVPPRRSSMVPLPSGANCPSSSRIGYSQNTIMGALA
jgi:hypothetical protein